MRASFLPEIYLSIYLSMDAVRKFCTRAVVAGTERFMFLFATPAQAGRHVTPSRPLPNATEGAAFLHAPHLLRETNLGSPRFVAVQSPLPSIFTWWNILDATMASAPSGSTHSSTFWQVRLG